MPSETAYSEVKRLVSRFKALSAATRRAYNEDNTRKDLIRRFSARWNGTPRTAPK